MKKFTIRSDELLQSISFKNNFLVHSEKEKNNELKN